MNRWYHKKFFSSKPLIYLALDLGSLLEAFAFDTVPQVFLKYLSEYGHISNNKINLSLFCIDSYMNFINVK